MPDGCIDGMIINNKKSIQRQSLNDKTEVVRLHCVTAYAVPIQKLANSPK